jgi:hypothetical protein
VTSTPATPPLVPTSQGQGKRDGNAAAMTAPGSAGVADEAPPGPALPAAHPVGGPSAPVSTASPQPARRRSAPPRSPVAAG